MKTVPVRSLVRAVLLAAGCLAAFPAFLAAAPAAEGGHGGGMAGYEVVRLGRAHLNRLLLTATIEGKKGVLVVDTGAGGTSLSAAKFSALLPSGDRKLPAGVPATVPFNDQKVPVGYARDFHVGNVNLGALPVSIAPARLFFDAKMLYDSSSGLESDGLLGENILRHYNAIIDCARLLLYLNTDPKRKLDAGRGLVAAGWTRVPMVNEHSHFAVDCQVGDKTGRLIVDTGSPFVSIDSSLLLGAHVVAQDTHLRGGLVGTRAEAGGLARLDTMTIGDYHADGSYIMAQPRLGSYLNNKNGGTTILGLLGGDFLARNNAIIDIGNHCLYLKRSAATGAKP